MTNHARLRRRVEGRTGLFRRRVRPCCLSTAVCTEYCTSFDRCNFVDDGVAHCCLRPGVIEEHGRNQGGKLDGQDVHERLRQAGATHPGDATKKRSLSRLRRQRASPRVPGMSVQTEWHISLSDGPKQRHLRQWRRRKLARGSALDKWYDTLRFESEERPTSRNSHGMQNGLPCCENDKGCPALESAGFTPHGLFIRRGTQLTALVLCLPFYPTEHRTNCPCFVFALLSDGAQNCPCFLFVRPTMCYSIKTFNSESRLNF